MSELERILESDGLASPLAEAQAKALAGQLSQESSCSVYWRSITAAHNALYFMGRVDQGDLSLTNKVLGILYTDALPRAQTFSGDERPVRRTKLGLPESDRPRKQNVEDAYECTEKELS